MFNKKIYIYTLIECCRKVFIQKKKLIKFKCFFFFSSNQPSISFKVTFCYVSFTSQFLFYYFVFFLLLSLPSIIIYLRSTFGLNFFFFHFSNHGIRKKMIRQKKKLACQGRRIKFMSLNRNIVCLCFFSHKMIFEM